MRDIVGKYNNSDNIDSGRNVALDGVRGIVAIIIALFHFELYVPFGENKIFAAGYLGVEFFFILSGFLLTKGYLNKQENNSKSIFKIMKDKFIRLYPAYLVSVMLLIILYSCLWFNGNIYAWLNSDVSHVKGTLAEFFCIQSVGIFGFHYINGPAWYVSALLITSIVILLLIKYFESFYIKYIAPIMSFMLYFSLYKMNMYMDPSSFIFGKISTAIVRALAGMMLGSFVWFIFTKFGSGLKRMSFACISIIEIVMIGFFFSMLLYREPSKWNYLIFIPITGIIIIMFSAKGIVSKILSMKVFTFLGKISYSFYLLQSICSNLVLNLFDEMLPWMKILIYILLNLASAFFLNYFIENLFNKYILKKYRWAKKIFFFGVGILVLTVLINYNNNRSIFDTGKNGDLIIITALDEQNELAEGNEVWINGFMIDGNWYSADTIFDEGWINDEGSLGWRSYEQPQGMQYELRGILPYGTERQIITRSNRWQGIFKIDLRDGNTIVDSYSDSESNEKITNLQGNTNITEKNDNYMNIYFDGVYWFLILVILLLIVFNFYKNYMLKRKLNIHLDHNVKSREQWADILRIFCITIIVYLHATCDGYVSGFADIEKWFKFLYINSFTACAVPIFFMISGTFIIKNEDNFFVTLLKRLKKLVFPLIVWSIIYLIARKWYVGEDINLVKQIIKIGSEPQYSHLWFVYTLLGVYILSPIISYVYYRTEKKILYYLTIVFGIIPLVLKTIETATNYHVNLSYIYMFFPEAMLFILGKLIVDNKHRIVKKWYIWLAGSIVGYGMVVISSYYYTIKLNTPFKGFFSNYGTIPIFIMYTSLFCMFLSLEDKFNLINKKLQKYIYILSEASMGVYFIHMLIYMLLEGKQLFGKITLSISSNRLFVVSFTSLMCILISFTIIITVNKVKKIIVHNYLNNNYKE